MSIGSSLRAADVQVLGGSAVVALWFDACWDTTDCA